MIHTVPHILALGPLAFSAHAAHYRMVRRKRALGLAHIALLCFSALGVAVIAIGLSVAVVLPGVAILIAADFAAKAKHSIWVHAPILSSAAIVVLVFLMLFGGVLQAAILDS